MRLTNKQLDNYRTKISQLAHAQCILHDNGIFEIHNVSEQDSNNIVSVLRRQKYIADVRALAGRYNFNKFDFSKGMPEPEKYFTIRGILKEDNLEEAVEIHQELNPKIWTEDKELIPEVRAKILQIVEKFKTLLATDNVELKIEDIYLLGSNANYNYNEDSDLDIHIIADESFDCSKEHLKLIYDAYKTLFNKKYTITIKGINVELYVENKDKLSNVSAGVYSFNKGWIKQPSRFEIPEFDQFAVDKGVQTWESKFYAVTENPSIKKIDEYVDSIYEMRQESIQKDGEFGEGNLIFKEIRRLGYLQDLKDLKTELTSKELSLESLDEDLIVCEPEEGKDKLGLLKHLIENEEVPDVKSCLLTLMDIYLFQTYKPSDRENSTLTDEEWQEYADFCKAEKEKGKKESLNEGCWGMPHTLAEVNKLKELMSKPVDAFEVGDHINNKNDDLGIGDDELYDRISKYRSEHPYDSKAKRDVRKVIQKFIKDEVLPNWDNYSYSTPEGTAIDHEKWEDGVKEVFEEIAKMKLAEEKEKLTYHYRGPVKHFSNIISDDWEDYTEAVSDAQALNNLTAKAKKYFGYIMASRITLNPDYLELVLHDDDIHEPIHARAKCPACGTFLNDSGECPYCDLGDSSVLED